MNGPAECWKLIQERSIRNEQTGCLVWQGHTNPKGYGMLRCDGVDQGVHRVSWMANNGRIPNGMHVLHSCDNRRCGEVTHLFLGTNADNILDKMMKGRAGRKLTQENVSEIKVMLSEGHSQASIARLFNCDQSNISKIKTGKYWPFSEKGRVVL